MASEPVPVVVVTFEIGSLIIKPEPGVVGAGIVLLGIPDAGFVQLRPEAEVIRLIELLQSTSRSMGTVIQ